MTGCRSLPVVPFIPSNVPRPLTYRRSTARSARGRPRTAAGRLRPAALRACATRPPARRPHGAPPGPPVGRSPWRADAAARRRSRASPGPTAPVRSPAAPSIAMARYGPVTRTDTVSSVGTDGGLLRRRRHSARPPPATCARLAAPPPAPSARRAGRGTRSMPDGRARSSAPRAAGGTAPARTNPPARARPRRAGSRIGSRWQARRASLRAADRRADDAPGAGRVRWGAARARPYNVSHVVDRRSIGRRRGGHASVCEHAPTTVTNTRNPITSAHSCTSPWLTGRRPSIRFSARSGRRPW